MQLNAILIRARRALTAAASMPANDAIKYALGKGGFMGDRPFPWNPSRECDCSGFASWCAGSSRMRREIEGGWIETTAVFHDAREHHRLFHDVPMGKAEPGDFIVYGDAGGHQGHIGVISEVDRTASPDKRITRVIHCSHGNAVHTGSAVRETDPSVFMSHGGSIVARWNEAAAVTPPPVTNNAEGKTPPAVATVAAVPEAPPAATSEGETTP